MSSKETIHFSVDPENKAWLDETTDNRSAYLNRLLTRAREGSDDMDLLLAKYQLEQLRGQEASLESRLDNIRQQKARIQKKAEIAEEHQEDVLEEARVALEHVDLEPDNPAVINWAKKAEMDVSELIEEMRDDE